MSWFDGGLFVVKVFKFGDMNGGGNVWIDNGIIKKKWVLKFFVK